VGLAIKEELQGGANPDPSKQAFLAEALQHLYENVLLEAQAGHFVLSCEDSEKLCRRIAEDAYELRRLYGLWSSGKISKRKLRCTPLYRRQQEYFDRPPMFRNMVSYAEQMMETRRVQRN
jgi:hypothetical protein